MHTSPFIANAASSPTIKLSKKFGRRRQRSTNHSAKCNRRGKSVGSNWCRTCILYGCQRSSNFVILLKLEEEISMGFRRALTRGFSSSNALIAAIKIQCYCVLHILALMHWRFHNRDITFEQTSLALDF